MIYSSFEHAALHYKDIQPIDYFFAKEFTTLFNESDNSLLFHLFICLSESVRHGHTCLPVGAIANRRTGFESDNTGLVNFNGYQFPSADKITETLTLILGGDTNTQHAIVLYRNCLYMRKNFLFEQELQQALVTKLSQTLNYNDEQVTAVVNELFDSSLYSVEQQEGPQQLDWQKLAVANSLNKRFAVIAGGPGTGKTYTVTKLLAAIVKLAKAEQTITLVAPTGKAAQRLTESLINAIAGFRGQISDDILDKLPTTAQTIHRLLGVLPHQVNFKHHQGNPLHTDVVIIDEVSMVDLALLTRFFRALPEHCQVIMLGDADQLPSVALGSVLADIAKRPHLGYSPDNLAYLNRVLLLNKSLIKQLPHASKQGERQLSADHLSILMKSRRFDDQGSIGKLAKWVIEGNSSESWQFITEGSLLLPDIHWLKPEITHRDHQKMTNFLTKTDDWLIEAINLYYRPIQHMDNINQAYEQLNQFRILCATRVGQQGVECINQQIMQYLTNTAYTHYDHNSQAEPKLYHGLPIMINENHYGLELYNGDIGLIWQNESGQLVAYFESSVKGEYRYFMPSRLPRYEPVYAMTIHKTQGSEFSHVAMVLPPHNDNNMLSRELLYTGITRAKKQLSIYCSKAVWFSGVEAHVHRHSNLNLNHK